MARQVSHADTDDIMIDDERDRLNHRGKLTPQKRAAIQFMREVYGATAEAIAGQMQIDVDTVQTVLNEIKSDLKL
ncbi:hypothetical protein [Rhizobium sp.]|jgi:DNA-directed RNA polymerase specialized sigma24 family protein|uniref:hypothetical protein n=1 Tax=Rhizobium sp. TaxID=391 RepID=UPI0028973878